MVQNSKQGKAISTNRQKKFCKVTLPCLIVGRGGGKSPIFEKNLLDFSLLIPPPPPNQEFFFKTSNPPPLTKDNPPKQCQQKEKTLQKTP